MPLRDNPPTSRSATDFQTDDEPAFALRATIERVLHGLAVVILAFLIWQAVHVLRQRPDVYASGKDVRSSLIQWTTRSAPERGHVSLDSVPTPDLRDWIAAFPGANTQMTWEGVSLKPSAVSVEPVADPKHPTRIWISAPPKSVVSVSDALGQIDSVVVQHGGGVLTVPRAQGEVRATVDGTTATSTLRDSLTIKPVLVIGIASWEAKFVMASLEEYGWKVDGRFFLSPKAGDVTQFAGRTNTQNKSGDMPRPGAGGHRMQLPNGGLGGGMGGGMGGMMGGQQQQPPGADQLGQPSLPEDGDDSSPAAQRKAPIQIDTSRYAAVIVLDSSAKQYAGQLAEYVRKGGGLIAAGEAAGLQALGELTAGRLGTPTQEHDFDIDSATPRNALALAPLMGLKPNAVPIEMRGKDVAVAARRVGDGRVLQVGYFDTWRWRMGGVEKTMDPFRGWWSKMVASIAYAPRHPMIAATPTEPTPMASLVSILGSPVKQAAPTASRLDDPRLLPWLFGLLMTVLLVEWASRRLRGQP